MEKTFRGVPKNRVVKFISGLPAKKSYDITAKIMGDGTIYITICSVGEILEAETSQEALPKMYEEWKRRREEGAKKEQM